MRSSFGCLARTLSVLGTLTLSAGHGVLAQGFDPAKVDWEKLSKIPMTDLFIKQFNEQCGSCHGEDLRGTSLGRPLVGVDLLHGDTVKDIARSIATGFPDKGMPGWSQTLNESQIWNLALYVSNAAASSPTPTRTPGAAGMRPWR